MKPHNDFYHQPVLLHESIEGLNVKPDGIFVDVTFGGGGHSREILKQLKKGTLVAFDQDIDAEKNLINDKHFVFVNHNFRYLQNFLRYHNIDQVDGIIADLGVSSHHFDMPERGFSFRSDAQLDMRMNNKSELTAQHIISTYTEQQLFQLFKDYGELKNARRIAYTLVQKRTEASISTTTQLVQALEHMVPQKKENQFFAKIFQALRIEVNQEIECLKELLEQSLPFLKKGGRLVIISYHSIEDRLVKNFIRWGNFYKEPEKDVYGHCYTPLKAVNRNVIIPNEDEIKVNNRARSAKLRIAEKL